MSTELQTSENDLPSWDDATSSFDQEEEKKLPSWEELEKRENMTALPAAGNLIYQTAKAYTPFIKHDPQELSDAQRIYAQQTPAWNVVKAFGHGFNQAAEEAGTLDNDTIAALTDAKIWDGYSEGEKVTNNAFVDGIVLPTVQKLYGGFSAKVGSPVAQMAYSAGVGFPSAVFAGTQEAVAQVGTELGSERLGRDLAGTLESEMFELGRPVVPHEIVNAKTNRVLESEAVYFGTKEPSVTQAASIEKISSEFRGNAETATTPRPPTIHEIVRQDAPELFERYDTLTVEREVASRQVKTMTEQRRAEAESSAPHTQEISDLQAKLENATPRMVKKYQEKIDDLTEKNEAFIKEKIAEDTPELAAAREGYQKADYAMRDLSPEVSRAYREAETKVPKEVVAEETKSVENAAEEVAKPETLTENLQTAAIKPLEEQRKFIIDDFTRRVTEAGRPLEEAQAVAELEAARYETLSQLYPKFTAEEWYGRESANLVVGKDRAKPKVRELAQKAKGKIRLATNDAKSTITLFERANASTLIHEKGHEWVDQLLRLADEADAPAQMKADAATLRKMGGAAEDGMLPTKGHEKFARGFERWLMEGVAPTKALEKVFAKFKQWLTAIYETVDRLKAPINNDIRDVYARMLAVNPEKSVIAADVSAGKSLSDIHIHEARTTEPAKAAVVRDNIEKEIDSTIKHHAPEIENEFGRPTSTTGAIETTPQGAGGLQPEAAPLAGGEGAGGAPGAEPGGGATPVGEGSGTSAITKQIVNDERKLNEKPTSPNQKLGPPESDLIDKAGNIRLDNLNTPEDVNIVLREAADQNNQFLGARRNVISDAQVIDLADALGMSAETLSARKLGQAFNAEQIVAARKLLIQSANDVRNLMNKAAQGGEDAVMAYAEAKARHIMIQEQVSGITAEAGRALRAFRELEGGKEAHALGDFLKQATGKDLFQLQEEARLGSQLETAQQISKFINDSKKPKFTDMILEYWINALLSGPMTHVKNMVGNMAVAVHSTIETAGAAGVGKIRETLGHEGDKVELGEARARLFGIAQGSRDGLIAGIKAFKTEESSGAHTIEQASRKNIPGVAGKIIRIPGRFLTAEDEVFKAIAYRQELNAQAYRTAAKEGLSGDAFNQRVAEITMNPSEELMQAARKNADYQTFTKQLGTVGRAIQTFSNSHFLAKLVVPFIRTPVNILKYAGERTPLGVFSKEVRDNLTGKNGKIAQDTQIARIGIGTAIATSAITMAQQGIITGGGPTDPAEKAMWRLAGNQPYSIRIGDVYYSYGWLDPFATILGVSADMAEISKSAETNEEDTSKMASAMFAAISKNLMGKLSLRGVSDLMQAATDPDRYGQGYINNFAGTLVPSFVAQVARTEDPTMRQMRSTSDVIKSRIPGQRETLMPVRDVWGEPIVREGSLGLDAISPVYKQKISKDPVNQALLKLQIFPSKPDRKIRGVDLTDKQYDAYTRMAGRMAKLRLNNLITQPGFQGVPEAYKIKVINNIISTSRENARSAVMMQNPEIMRQAVENKRRELQGKK